MAEVKGPEFIQQDYMMRLVHNDTLHQTYLETAPASSGIEFHDELTVTTLLATAFAFILCDIAD